VIALCNAPLGTGGSWGEDSNIIAALSTGVLSWIPSAGGAHARDRTSARRSRPSLAAGPAGRQGSALQLL
jgi:hypothetical protein